MVCLCGVLCFLKISVEVDLGTNQIKNATEKLVLLSLILNGLALVLSLFLNSHCRGSLLACNNSILK